MCIESVMLSISSSVIPVSLFLQSFSASWSVPKSQLFTLGGQNIRASSLASVFAMNINGWFPYDWLLISSQSKGLLRVFYNTTVQEHQFFGQISHLYMTNGKTIDLTIRTFVSKVMSLLFNKLSRFVKAFLPKLLWLYSPSAVILGIKKRRSVTVSPSFAIKWWDQMPWS